MKPKVVVRKVTDYWKDSRGALHMKISLLPQKKKSKGYNWLAEDTLSCEVMEIMPTILNLNEVEDGVYEAVMCNISRGIEYGELDSYDIELVPYTEEEETYEESLGELIISL